MKKKTVLSLILVVGLVLTVAAETGEADSKGCVVVDDFDSYENSVELYWVWNDYWANESGAEIFLEEDPTFARDGNSVMLLYHNLHRTKGKYVGSWMDANPADLEVGPDWTIGGVNTLSLYFYGQTGNSDTPNDVMWVQLDDTSSNAGVVLYDGDANDVTEEEWHEWNIDLEIFDACGVDLTEVGSVSVGFGGYRQQIGQTEYGGTGTVHFDDIRLCAPECELELSVSVTPETLWPPNRKMVLITPTLTTVADCDESPDVSLVDITINENGDVVGDIGTSDDIQIAEDGSIYLRAKRGRAVKSRVYNIIYQATDDFGNVAAANATVTVPHKVPK